MRGYTWTTQILPLICVLLNLVCALPLRAQGEEQPLTLSEYRAELDAAIDALEAVDDANAAPVIAQLQAHFATITHVEYDRGVGVAGDGGVVVVSSLLDDLPVDAATTPDDAESDSPHVIALARLRGVAAQIDAMPTDNTAVRLQLLQRVLARPEFNTPTTLWERFWRWFTEWLSDLLPDRVPGRGSGLLAGLAELIPWIITVAIVAAVIWLLSYWLQRVLRAFVKDARVAEFMVDGEMPTTAAAARQQARSAAQSGNYRDAVRRLYLAALLQLAEHDLISYERSLTNREVLVRVPVDSPIRPHLEPVITTFDRVWYGIREPDLATFHAYEQEIDELAAVARQATPGSNTLTPGTPSPLRRGDT